MKKTTKIFSIAFLTSVAMCSILNGQAILVDLGTDDNASRSASISEFAEAGVSFDATIAEVFHLQASGTQQFQANTLSDGGLSLTLESSGIAFGFFGTPVGDLSENDMLRDYATVNDLPGTNVVTGTISGLELQNLSPSTQTTLYLFGAGAASGQSSTFQLTNFFGETSSGDPLTTVSDTTNLNDHFVTFDFVTPSQILGTDSITFTWTVPAGRTGRTSLNGFAIVQAPPEPSLEPIFELTFDDSFVGSEGETPLSNSGAVLGRGVRGLTAILDSDDIVQYESAGNIDSQNGTIDFIVIPFWNGNDGVTHEFLVWGGGGGLLFSKDGANNLRQIFNRFSPGGQSEIGTAINVSDWVALEPHYLAYSWSADQRRLRQYVDGQMVREVDFPDGFILPTITAPDFRLGSNTNGGLDELRLFDREVTPGEVENRFNELLGVPATLGDVDLDGDVDFADIPAFIAVLQSGVFQAEADCDENGVVDFSDIPAFIAILQGA